MNPVANRLNLIFSGLLHIYIYMIVAQSSLPSYSQTYTIRIFPLFDGDRLKKKEKRARRQTICMRTYKVKEKQSKAALYSCLKSPPPLSTMSDWMPLVRQAWLRYLKPANILNISQERSQLKISIPSCQCRMHKMETRLSFDVVWYQPVYKIRRRSRQLYHHMKQGKYRENQLKLASDCRDL